MTLTNVKITNPEDGTVLYVAAPFETTLEAIIAYAQDPTREIEYAVTDLEAYRQIPGLEGKFFGITNFVELYADDADQFLVLNNETIVHFDGTTTPVMP